MACDYWGIENHEGHLHAYNSAMDLFSLVYYVECILKLIGLAPDGYFGDGWNRFDFTLVCTSLVDQFATELLARYLPLPPMLLRVLRVFRVLRIVRLLKSAKGLRDLLMTMVYSAPALVNVGSLLFLVVFIYAVLGMSLFPYVMQGDNVTPERNFETFSAAMLRYFNVIGALVRVRVRVRANLARRAWKRRREGSEAVLSEARVCEHFFHSTAHTWLVLGLGLG